MKRPNTHIIIYFFLLFVFFALNASAQDKAQDDVKKNADEYFKSEEYALAMPLYSQLLSIYPKDVTYNYRFGVCLLFADTRDVEKPLKYLEFASSKDGVDKAVFYYLGMAYHRNYRFTDAIREYNIYKDKASTGVAEKLDVDRQIEICNNAKSLLKQYSDIYVLQKTEVLSKDFFRSYDVERYGGKILVKPDALKTPLDKKKEKFSLCFYSKEENEVYFSSYGKNGSTGKDIYKATKQKDGKWSTPVSLGPTINTPYDEDFPFMLADGATIYYSSKGRNTIGGYDIYTSTLNEGVWEEPENLNFPINTPFDDIMFVPDLSGKYAYFSSARESMNGMINVYRVRIDKRPENKEALVFDISNTDADSLYNKTLQFLKENASLEVNATESMFEKQDQVVADNNAVNNNVNNKEVVNANENQENNDYEIPDDMSNQDIVNVADKQATQSKKELSELKSKRDAAKTIATNRKAQATDKYKEAEKNVAEAEKTTDNNTKETLLTQAATKRSEGDQLNKEAIIADNIASQLDKQVVNKQKETEEAIQYNEDIKKALQSNSFDSSIAMLERMTERLKNTPVDTSYDDLALNTEYINKKVKEEEALNKQSKILNEEINSLKADAETYKKQAEETKKDTEKDELIKKAADIEVEASTKQNELDNLTLKKESLKDDLDSARKQNTIYTAIVEDINTNSAIAQNKQNAANSNVTPDKEVAVNTTNTNNVNANKANENNAANINNANTTTDNKTVVNNNATETNANNAANANNNIAANTNTKDTTAIIANNTELINNAAVSKVDNNKTVTNNNEVAVTNVDNNNAITNNNNTNKNEVAVTNENNNAAVNNITEVSANNVNNANNISANQNNVDDTSKKIINATAAVLKKQSEEINAISTTKSEESVIKQKEVDNIIAEANAATDSVEKVKLLRKAENAKNETLKLSAQAEVAASVAKIYENSYNENNNQSGTNENINPNVAIENYSKQLTTSLNDKKYELEKSEDNVDKLRIKSYILSKVVKDLKQQAINDTANSDDLLDQAEKVEQQIADVKQQTETEDNKSQQLKTETQSIKYKVEYLSDLKNEKLNTYTNTAALAVNQNNNVVVPTNNTANTNITTEIPTNQNAAINNANTNIATETPTNTNVTAVYNNANTNVATETPTNQNEAVNNNANANNASNVNNNVTTNNANVNANNTQTVTANNTAVTNENESNANNTAVTNNNVNEVSADNNVSANNNAAENIENKNEPEVNNANVPSNNIVNTDYNLPSNKNIESETNKVTALTTTQETEVKKNIVDKAIVTVKTRIKVLQSSLKAVQNETTKANINKEITQLQAYQNTLQTQSDNLHSQTTNNTPDPSLASVSVNNYSEILANDASKEMEKAIEKRKEANNTTDVKEKESLRKEAAVIEKNAENKYIESFESKTLGNTTDYYNNSLFLDSIKTNYKGNPQATTATLIENEAKYYFDKADALKKTINDSMSYYTKKSIYNEVLANENTAIEKQQKAFDVYKQMKPTYASNIVNNNVVVPSNNNANTNITTETPTNTNVTAVDNNANTNVATETPTNQNVAVNNANTNITTETLTNTNVTAVDNNANNNVTTETPTNQNVAVNENVNTNITTETPTNTNVTAVDNNTNNNVATETTTNQYTAVNTTTETNVNNTTEAANYTANYNTAVAAAGGLVPLNNELPAGVVFKVQFCAVKQHLSPDVFEGIPLVTAETTNFGMYRYMSGLFTIYNTARTACTEIKNDGYPDAFIVAYINGKRVSVADALAMIKTGNIPVANANVATTGILTNPVSGIKGLFYSVQVGVYVRPVTSAQLFKITPLYDEIMANGYYRYLSGTFNNLQQAVAAKNVIVTKGVTDAFVVVYYNGKKISYDEAKALQAAGNVNIEVENTAISTVDMTGITFKVQVGAYKNEVPTDILNKWLDIVVTNGLDHYITDNGITIYISGSFKNYDAAGEYKNELISKGITDAYVVAFKNNQKINITKEMELMK
ncbi:MAG TPA: hypothetical protein PKK00_10510 [Bacteroidales bacterium]|nr:hypothetical protein [Bacteroidales bacterium]HPS17755.1 hypothetical protein [Bacteroidales bacterium]